MEPVHILNVDDDEAGRFATTHTLRLAGFHVTEAENGREALALVQKPTDLVLLDVNLPDLDGHEVCRIIKNDPRTSSIPVVQMSATRIESRDKIEGLDSGADGYLVEPVTSAELVATVRAFLRIREAEAEQRFLATASETLAHARTSADLLAHIAELAVPFLGHSSVIYDVDDGGAVQARVMTRRDPSLPSLEGAELEGALSLAARGQGSELPEMVVVPLMARERVRAVLTVAFEPEGERHGRRMELAQDLAVRGALALDNLQLLERTEAAVRTRDAFLALVSHDLRGLLTAISTSNQLIERTVAKGRNLDRLPRFTEAIGRASDRMNRLIADLLDLASIDAGQLRFDTQTHPVGALLQQVVAVLQPVAAERGIELRTEQTTDASALCDETRTQQVLTNLVGNALKFTPPGGSVSLSVETTGANVCFSVRDTGPGIPEDEQARLFDRFWRAADGQRGGTGLGLSIAKGIVEAQGGRIWVSSRPGAGSTFYFTLPRAV